MSLDIVVFNVLQASGFFILAITFATGWLSSRVKRTLTWYTLLAVGVLYSVVQLLLLGQQEGPPPNRAICIIQGILIYPMTAMWVARQFTCSNEVIWNCKECLDRSCSSFPGLFYVETNTPVTGSITNTYFLGRYHVMIPLVLICLLTRRSVD